MRKPSENGKTIPKRHDRFVRSWILDAPDRRSLRRRLIAALRMACRTLGLGRKRLGLGALGIVGGVRMAGLAMGAMGAILLLGGGAAHAQYKAGTGSTADSLDFLVLDRNNPGNPGNASPYYRSKAVRSTAVGENSSASGGGVALGDHAHADKEGSIGAGVAIGAHSYSLHSGVAIGAGVLSTGNLAIAMGRQAGATGNYSSALGAVSWSQGAGSVAVGHGSYAADNGAIAIGGQTDGLNWNENEQTRAQGVGAIAIGNKATTDGDQTLALGSNATANHLSSVALGAGSRTATVVGTQTMTIGGVTHNLAGGAPIATVSVGGVGAERTITNVGAGRVSETSTDGINGSQLFATNTAIENLAGAVEANATHYFSVNSGQTGAGSNYDNDGATGANSLAAGVGAEASGNSGTAVGHEAEAAGNNSTAVGARATAEGTSSTALGTRATASAGSSIAIGSNAETAQNANSAIAIGTNSSATSGSAIAVGSLSEATGSASIAMGNDAGASGASSIAIGHLSSASPSGTGGFALAVGYNSNAADRYAVALGAATEALAFQTVAIGRNATAGSTNAIAIGPNALASGGGGLALGFNTRALNSGDVALGSGSITRDATSVEDVTINGQSYTFAGSNPASVLSVGADGAERQIVNVAAGEVSETSTDAVNGSQLHATNQAVEDLDTNVGELDDRAVKYDLIDPLDPSAGIDYSTITLNPDGDPTTITNLAAGAISANSLDAVNGSQLWGTADSIASHLGGTDYGVSVNPDGTLTAPTYEIAAIDPNGNVTTTPHDNVGDALGGLSDSLTNVNSQIENLGDEIGGLQDDALLWDEDQGAYSANHGGDGPSVITDVADGELSETSTDAVNGSQLHETNQRVDEIDGRVTTIEGDIVDIRGDITEIDDRVTNIEGDVAEVTDRAVTYDGDVGDPKDTITLKGEDGTLITNLQDGEISEDSTDAVNGSQLHETNQAVAEMDDFAIQYDRDADGNKTNTVSLVGGDPNAPVLISNVAAGEADTDAVNVGQLNEGLETTLIVANTYTDDRVNWGIEQSNNYTDQVAVTTLHQANEYTDYKFGQLSQEIGDVRGEARQAAAIGLAAASLRYDDRPGKISVALGGGVWRGEGAFAFGTGYTSENGRVRANLSATTSGGHWGAGAGLSFTLN